MPGSKVLVLGCTGPGGICLLRELLSRGHATIAYCRSPGKIPAELANNPLLEVMKGTLEDLPTLERAVSQSCAVLSILGPPGNIMKFRDPDSFPRYYASLFPLLRAHGVKRILAMSTISAPDPKDGSGFLPWLLVTLVRLLAKNAFLTMNRIVDVFKREADGLDWTVYRLAGFPGGHDEEAWKRERDSAPIFVGYVGQKGYTMATKRAVLAKWLVDTVEKDDKTWVGKTPAIANMAGGKVRSE